MVEPCALATSSEAMSGSAVPLSSKTLIRPKPVGEVAVMEEFATLYKVALGPLRTSWT